MTRTLLGCLAFLLVQGAASPVDAPPWALLIGTVVALIVFAGVGIMWFKKKKAEPQADKPQPAAASPGKTNSLVPPKREAPAVPARPAVAVTPPAPPAPPRPAAAAPPPPAPVPPPPAPLSAPALEFAAPAPAAPAFEAPAAPPAPPVAADPPAGGGLFDPNALDSSLDALFSEPEAKAPPAASPPLAEAPADGGLFDPNALDSSLDALFSEAMGPAEVSPAAPVAAEAPASGGLFDPNALDSSLDQLFGGGGPAAEPKPAAPVEEARPDLGTFDLSSFSLDNVLSDAPAAAPAPEPAPTFQLPTEPAVAQAAPPVSSPPAPAADEAAEKKPDGLISIGKLLVDQGTLEEIIRTAEKGGAGLTTTQVISAVKGQTLDTLLADVNKVPGVLGSLIVGRDGLVITNTMPSDVDKDLVGALTSSLFANIDIQIKRMQRGLLKRLILETDVGLSILAQLEMGTMVVFTERDVNLPNVLTAVGAISGGK